MATTMSLDTVRSGSRVLRLIGAIALALAAVIALPTPGAHAEPIGTITTFPSSNVGPNDITAGADGNLWFTNIGDRYAQSPGPHEDSIGKITPTGVVTIYVDPDISVPDSITPGPDGNVWFVNTGTNSIGRITPTGTISTYTDPGIASPQAITAGPDGNLWFTNRGNGSIGRMTLGGVVATYTDPGITSPAAITTGPDGNVWFINGSDSIGKITPTGTVTVYHDPGIKQPLAITAGPDGNLWFTNPLYGSPHFNSGSIGRITRTGAVTIYSGPGIVSPSDIAAGPDGYLWFTDSLYAGIGRIAPDGTSSQAADSQLATPAATTPDGLGSIAAGPDGNLWITSNSQDLIGRITPGGTSDYFRVGSGMTDPVRITAGPDGSMWFTNDGALGSIGRITSTGTITTYSDPRISGPRAIVTGPDGNLWFANYFGDSIGRITTTGTVTVFTDPGISAPWDIAVGPDNNLWFTNTRSQTIGRITPSGRIDHFSGPGIIDPQEITAGPDGNIWFTNYSSATEPFFGSIGRITPTGSVTTFTDPAFVHPRDIAAGPDGNMWLTTLSSKTSDFAVARITPAGVITIFTDPGITTPTDITAGPDGNLWFSNNGFASSIGRITPTGTVTTYTDPAASSPLAITSGPDDNVWFVNAAFSNGSIGRIYSGALPTAPAHPSGVAGSGRIDVSWTASSTLADTPVLDYTATAEPGGEMCTTTGALACAITGLTNGTAYTITVTATNSIGTSVPSAPSTPITPTTFPDVPGGHPFLNEIEWLASSGITTGYPDGRFRPRSAVTRQAMAAFLWRDEGQPGTTLTEPYFADVPTDHPFYDAIQWMAETGLSTGSENPTGSKPLFKPSDPVSRQVMAGFRWRQAGEPTPTLTEPYFADVPADHPFYDAIQWMAETGLSLGSPDPADGKPLYRPADAVSRQAMAAFFYRFDHT